MSGTIPASLLAAGGRYAWREIKAWSKRQCKPIGEWRGKLVCERLGQRRWLVRQDAADPCRLWVPAVGLEYAWSDGFESDGPSIPAVACKVLHCTIEDFLRDGFLHDHAYHFAFLFARPDGRSEWSMVPLTRREADVLIRVGVAADGATEGQAAAIFGGVRTFGERAWREWRKKDV